MSGINGICKSKKDEGYACLLECKTDQLVSSHQVKRFFRKLSGISNSVFNKILNELFIWRLHISKPKVIELGVDDHYYTILDSKYEFLNKNSSIPRWIIDSSVLIDSENKIKMAGAPWVNEDMKNLFYEIVSDNQ